MFEHATALEDVIEGLGRNDPRAVSAAAAFRNVLDAFATLQVSVEQYLPAEILDRFQSERGREDASR